MVTLYDQFGRPIERAATKKPEHRPLAAAPIRDAWRDYVASGLTPVKLAQIFREADSGDLRRQAELFDQIEERDGHIIGEISKRRNVILDVAFQVSPASEDSRDVQISEAVEEMLGNITDWADVLVCLQDGVGKGFSAMELKWDVSEGQAQVEDFKFIEQKRFLFYDQTGILSHIPRLVTDEESLGIDIPAWKMIYHRYGGKSGHATRSGIYRVCTWWYLFKNYAVKDWMIFCEVYGMPLRLGKYDPGASQGDRDALEVAVRTLGSDAAGVISKSTEIEFVQGNKGTSGADLYKDLAAFGNKEMSKAILGGTLTADVDGQGSYAAANTHNEVRLDLLRSDARALAATIRNQLIRPWVGFNYGWDVPCPGYEGDFEEAEDLKSKSEIIDKLSPMMDIPVSWVRKVFSIPEPEKGEECLRATGAGSSQNPQAMAPQELPPQGVAPQGVAPQELPPQGVAPQEVAKNKRGDSGVQVAAKNPVVAKTEDFDPLSPLSDRLDREASPYVDEMTETVRSLMENLDTLEELRDLLIDAWQDLDVEELGIKMAQAMAAAELLGMYEVSSGDVESGDVDSSGVEASGMDSSGMDSSGVEVSGVEKST